MTDLLKEVSISRVFMKTAGWAKSEIFKYHKSCTSESIEKVSIGCFPEKALSMLGCETIVAQQLTFLTCQDLLTELWNSMCIAHHIVCITCFSLPSFMVLSRPTRSLKHNGEVTEALWNKNKELIFFFSRKISQISLKHRATSQVCIKNINKHHYHLVSHSGCSWSVTLPKYTAHHKMWTSLLTLGCNSGKYSIQENT